MCRMFAYVGYSIRDLQKLFQALKESAKDDIVASKYKINNVHGDGWGYVIYDEKHLYYYRTEKPIFGDSLPPLDISGKFYAIFHARQATDKSTVSARFSHPFMESNNKYFYFLAHNGSLDVDELKKKLGFEGFTTDSELATKYFSLTENNEYLKQVTESALNLLILRIRREDGSAELFYENYYVKDRPEYYDLYIWDGEKGIAVVSSTLKYYGIKDVKDVKEKGKLLKLEFE